MARTKQVPRKCMPGKSAHKQISINTSVGGNVKKSLRYRPSAATLRDIRPYQKPEASVINRIPFQREVVKIVSDFKSDVRFPTSVLSILEYACFLCVIDATVALAVDLMIAHESSNTYVGTYSGSASLIFKMSRCSRNPCTGAAQLLATYRDFARQPFNPEAVSQYMYMHDNWTDVAQHG